MSYFADKILLFGKDQPSIVDTVQELKGPWPSLGLILDHFNLLSQKQVDRILITVKPTTCPIDPYPLSLVKSCSNRTKVPLREFIHLFLTSGTFRTTLKEMVIGLFFFLNKPLGPTFLANYLPMSNPPYSGCSR